jgi:DNA-binding response OmpR family regulator
MRILLVTLASAGEGDGAESPARVLADLGCTVEQVRAEVALAQADVAALAPGPPPAQAILIDARDRLEAGYACLKRLRTRPELAATPALVALTTARLPSLDFGAADDFVLWPLVPAELYARLRQLDWRLAAFASEERVKVGDLTIDLAGYEAHLRDRRLELTHQEFELLKFLAQQRGKVFTREQLLARVWGYRYYGGTRTVDIHVRRLRAKLGPGADQMIETVRNVGYKMRAG